jgi:transcriptional regulator with XRE-family HTH domain
MGKKSEDPAMTKVRSLFKESGLSLHDLGLKMGYDPEIARQSAFQFMKAADPRVSMLRRFAKGMGVPIGELVDEADGKKRTRRGKDN